MKKITAFLLALVLMFTCLSVVACNSKEIKVILHSNNGDATQTLDYDTATVLPTPTRRGYTFGGWFTDEDCSDGNKFAEGTPMKDNFHLYAKWIKNEEPTPNKYTVTLVYNDGVTDNTSLTVSEGGQVSFPTTPKRDGYVFDGWYTAMVGGEQWTNQPVTKDVTLYAHWTQEVVVPTKVTVTLNYNDGVTETTYIQLDKGNTVQLPTPKRDGYTFDGWFTALNGGEQWSSSKAINENITLYAHWTKNEVSVPASATLSLVGTSTRTSYSTEKIVHKGSDITYTNDKAASDLDCYNTTNNTFATRAYAGSTITIEYVYAMTSIVFTLDDGTYNGKQYLAGFDNMSVSGATVSRSGDTVTVKFNSATKAFQSAQLGSQVRILSVTVYTDGTGGGGSQGGTQSHTHDFGDSYFTYVKCKVNGCTVYGRNESQRKYDNMFDFNSTKQSQINANYNKLVANLSSASDFASFKTLYEQFIDDLDYVDAQYYWASVYYDVNENFNFNSVDTFYTTLFANYCNLFKVIDSSAYSSQFWTWSGENREECLALAEMYGDSTYQSEADAVVDNYNTYMNSIGWSISSSTQRNRINSYYGQLVTANNNIAKAAGYSNYMDFAYENVYYRDYTPSDVATMRKFVKQYVGPLLMDVCEQMDSLMSYDYYYGYYYEFDDVANEDYYYGLTQESLFSDTSYEYFDSVRNAIDYISQYFEFLSDSNIGKQQINFLKEANELFKNGNYFTGTGEGAYTMWVPRNQLPVVYFQLGDEENIGYDTAFTFVHEFGHYYESIYNRGLALSYDHEETHSQGNEMLFLAWLQANLPTGIQDGFAAVEVDQLFNMLSSVVMSTAVDEFEQACYAGSYNGSAVSSSGYSTLFNQILNSYATGLSDYLNTDYWAYVVFDNAAYYVSYAMSGLPSIELYTLAQQRGLTVAREAYFKLFTFSEHLEEVDVNNDGECSYAEVLTWCGLQDPFTEQLYKDLQSCLA